MDLTLSLAVPKCQSGISAQTGHLQVHVCFLYFGIQMKMLETPMYAQRLLWELIMLTMLNMTIPAPAEHSLGTGSLCMSTNTFWTSTVNSTAVILPGQHQSSSPTSHVSASHRQINDTAPIVFSRSTTVFMALSSWVSCSHAPIANWSCTLGVTRLAWDKT